MQAADDRESRSCSRAVTIRSNQILVILRHKDGVDYAVLPGGGIMDGETAEQAAERECKEETSITVKATKLLYDEPKRNGFPKTSYYLCQYIGGEPLLKADSEEFRRNTTENSYQPAWLDMNQAQKILRPHGIISSLELQR